MMTRVQELCRKLKPVMGKKIDRLWSTYLAESDADGKADIEQTLELLAVKHLGADYNVDRSPFPPPTQKFASAGDIRMGSVSYANKHISTSLPVPIRITSGRLSPESAST